jgi:hypothetical protein
MSDNSADATGSAETTGGIAALPPAVMEKADHLANRSVELGAEAAHSIGKAAESAADTLKDTSPALAEYIRNAANYTHDLADKLRDQKAGDLISQAVAWGRQQPLLVIAGAAVIGFALSRVVKSGASADGNRADGSGG